MSINNLKDARDRYHQISAECKALVDAADNRTDNPGKFTAEEQARFDALAAEQDAIITEFPGANRQTSFELGGAKPSRPRQGVSNKPEWLEARANPGAVDRMDDGGFDGIGEFLSAIADTSRGRYDDRLSQFDLRSQQSTSGTAGGYLIPQRYNAQLMMTAADEAPFLALRDIDEVRGPGSGLVRPALSDRDRSGEDVAGFALQRASENSTLADQTVTFESHQVSLAKAAGLIKVSNELMTDSAVGIDRTLRRVFARAVMQRQALDFVSGTGTGQPLGYLNSGALLTASRATNNEVSLADVAAMVSQLLPGSFGRAVWLAHPSVAEQIIQLSDSASNNVAVGQDATQQAPNALLGRPLFYTSACPALGSEGDLALVDPSAYLYVHRPLAIDVSGDSNFDSDQTTFRIVLRDAGQPSYGSSVVDEQGQSLSEFVALAA